MSNWKKMLSAVIAVAVFGTSIPVAPMLSFAEEAPDIQIEEAEFLPDAGFGITDQMETETVEETMEIDPLDETSEGVSLLNAAEVKDPIDDLIIAGLKLIVEHVAGSAIDFSTNKVLEALFGGDAASKEINKKLDEVLKNQEEMKHEIEVVEKMITDASLQKIINDFLTAYNDDVTYKNYYQMVTEIQKNTTYTPEEREEKMITALTSGMSDAEKASGDAEIDKYCQKIYALLVTEYTYDLTDNKTHSGNLLQVYRDYMREQVMFEHQADEALENFQDLVVGYYLNVAVIERLSLEARVKWCNDNHVDPISVETRIRELQSQLQGSDEEPYKKVGMDKLLKEQRPSEKPYRYFWVPGHEIKLMPVAITHQRPEEIYSWDDEKTIHQNELGGWKFKKSRGFVDKKLTESFWNPFWTYTSDEKNYELLSGSDYESILEAAGTYNSPDLKTLFFDKNIGNLSLDNSKHFTKDSRFLFKRTDETYPFEIKTHSYVVDHDYELVGHGISNVNKFEESPIELGRYMEIWDFKKYSYYAIHYESTIIHGKWTKEGKDTWYVLVAKYNDPNEEEYIDDEFNYDFSSDPDPVIPDDDDDSSYSNDVPSGALTGTWTLDADGSWTFTGTNGKTLTDSWAYIYNPYAKGSQPKAGWFRFDAGGKMLAGWFDAPDGNRYYLEPQSDNTKGMMLTGWQFIDGRWYYFSAAAGSGTMGAMLRNTVTPDGYKVDADGVWIP